MNIFSDFTVASVWIPRIIRSSFQYSAANAIEKNTILSSLDESTSHRRAILFYSVLIQNIGIWFDYDYFNFIPLGNDEITALAHYGTECNTLLKDKIQFRSTALKVRVIN